MSVKGSWQRPVGEKFYSEYDRIFGKEYDSSEDMGDVDDSQKDRKPEGKPQNVHNQVEQ